MEEKGIFEFKYSKLQFKNWPCVASCLYRRFCTYIHTYIHTENSPLRQSIDAIKITRKKNFGHFYNQLDWDKKNRIKDKNSSLVFLMLVEGDPKAHFFNSYYTKVLEKALLHSLDCFIFTLDPYLSVKQGAIKFHFLSLLSIYIYFSNELSNLVSGKAKCKQKKSNSRNLSVNRLPCWAIKYLGLP